MHFGSCIAGGVKQSGCALVFCWQAGSVKRIGNHGAEWRGNPNDSQGVSAASIVRRRFQAAASGRRV